MDHVKNIIIRAREYINELNSGVNRWEEILNKSRKLNTEEREIIMEKSIGKKPTPRITMGLLKDWERESNKRALEQYEKKKKEWEERNADII